MEISDDEKNHLTIDKKLYVFQIFNSDLHFNNDFL
jgi:hypothetical protein